MKQYIKPEIALEEVIVEDVIASSNRSFASSDSNWSNDATTTGGNLFNGF